MTQSRLLALHLFLEDFEQQLLELVAVADRLNYVAATDRANLLGNVEIIDHENIMRGARAEVDFDKEISRLLSDKSGKRVTGVLNP